MPFCPKCGKEVSAEATHCYYCGSQIIVEGVSQARQNETRKGTKTPILILGVIALLFIATSAYLYSENSMLNSQVTSLKSNINDLQGTYSTLQSSYNNLQSSYNSLQSEYNTVEQEYNTINSAYTGLCSNVNSLSNTLNSYTDLADSFQRTLNSQAVNTVASAVSSATNNNPNSWLAYQNIYNYIHNNVKYAYDIDMVNIGFTYETPMSGSLSGVQLMTGVSPYWTQNYVQAPSLTLSISQGDCEDQAILCYAMIEYYMSHIEGVTYNLYLADITMGDGTGHVAVFMPVQGGQICILDNAGNYLTSYWGSIGSKAASSELTSYSNYWSSRGGISNIILYNVNVNDGSYTIFASGNLAQIASALGS